MKKIGRLTVDQKERDILQQIKTKIENDIPVSFNIHFCKEYQELNLFDADTTISSAIAMKIDIEATDEELVQMLKIAFEADIRNGKYKLIDAVADAIDLIKINRTPMLDMDDDENCDLTSLKDILDS